MHRLAAGTQERLSALRRSDHLGTLETSDDEASEDTSARRPRRADSRSRSTGFTSSKKRSPRSPGSTKRQSGLNKA
jgi:hypothetical protein